jgi:hypothetical protein
MRVGVSAGDDFEKEYAPQILCHSIHQILLTVEK